jgi:predicted P-loop ATPase
MWEKMERAAFDTSDTSQGFAIAVIKKFMWQVKRKGMGLPVTNHLMPVLTGRQGGGKSTLVGNMLQPIFDGVKQTTFADISDNRLIDLWETPVLFMDEMSGAKKADMNIVKQSITASVLTRRPMRSNTDVQVQQCATFIGCSNEGLGEIIRDSSGIRRFAELDFAPCPDWEAMKEIDWLMLWHSVDEYGDDPSLHVMDALKEQQEDNRNMCSVEMWAREHAHEFKDWRKAGVLHEHFQDWENEKFPTYKTNVSIFGKRINTLIKQRPDFKWEAKKKSGYAWFRYVG